MSDIGTVIWVTVVGFIVTGVLKAAWDYIKHNKQLTTKLWEYTKIFAHSAAHYSKELFTWLRNNFHR